jgi:hypothetical protein
MEPRHAIILTGLFCLWTLLIIWFSHNRAQKLRKDQEAFQKFMVEKSDELQASMNELRTQGRLVNNVQRATSGALCSAARLLADVVMSVKHIANLSNGHEKKDQFDNHIRVILDAIEKIDLSAAENQMVKLGEYHDEQERLEQSGRRNDTARSRIKRGVDRACYLSNEKQGKE